MKNIKAKKFFKEFCGYAMTVGIAIAIAFIISLFLGCARVYGESMMPTYHDGEIIWLEKVSDEYERGEVVIVNEGEMLGGDDYFIIKRIVAVGGDVMRFDSKTDTLYINGEAVNEDYIAESSFEMGAAFSKEYIVPEGHVFVMGDNRNYSYDSRKLGCVPVEYIYGVPFDQR